MTAIADDIPVHTSKGTATRILEAMDRYGYSKHSWEKNTPREVAAVP